MFIVVYLALGAWIFQLLETPWEIREMETMRILKASFLEQHGCLTGQTLEKFIVAIVEADDRGVSAVSNVTMTELNWSFGQSLFFTSTIITTIGYGHVTPNTTSGKVFCIIYSVVGIPMTFILITALAERLRILTTYVLHVLNYRLGHLLSLLRIRLLHLAGVCVMVLMVAFVVPSAAFTMLEPEWGFMDSFYYCYISLTTIGLGDYIPGDDPHHSNPSLYKVIVTSKGAQKSCMRE
ncbi:PREDICTED: potassium channel subfamily K member 1-like [Priapulus caudatus]|uniref:Potassium channel subfamily K member 1-like n=1 Tax=Priapulus caudatus TaxID=37621 RepID=A0ABM1FC54_PRICU|nr:PREDICTED: potassium channel subfamily K member 1-like [Priapulus caudatus]